jgi:glycosyltransferase involved in cell wall biosynthesis
MSVETKGQGTASSSRSSEERSLISIIVPMFNEQDNVERTYAKLKEATRALPDYRFEILVTDNHSTDRTFEKLCVISKSDPDMRLVRFARNFGFQKSVLTGYLLARGAAAIQIDADLQDPPEMFGAFLEKWREGFDVVVGVRRNRKEGPVLRRSRSLFYKVMTLLDGPHLIPNAGDFRLIDRAVIERLRRIHEPHMYLRGLISSLARRQIGIPFDRAERIHNESKFRLGSLMHLATDGVLAHSSMPLFVSFFVGIFIAVGSVLLAAFYAVLRNFSPDLLPPGFATTQILILMGIGLNSTFLGVLGVYVGRIYDQVRNRPPTIIADIVNFDEQLDTVEGRLQR